MMTEEQLQGLLVKLNELGQENEDLGYTDKGGLLDERTRYFHRGLAQGIRRAQGELLAVTGHIKL